MAPVASSPSRLSECLSTPPPLDLLPHDPAVSSPPRFPRPATPWPHIPSVPNSSSILPSSPFDPDSLPPPSVYCHSLPDRCPISFLGFVPSTDFDFPSASPVHPSIRPEPLNSVAKLSPNPSLPPSSVPCDPEGAQIESACKAWCPARPNLVVSLLKEESSFDASKSVIGCCGDECFSKQHCCPDGSSPISAGTPDVLLNIPEGLESESGLGVPLEPTPAESERYSEALPTVPPLRSDDSVTDSLRHSYAQASSPLGVSWASVVEKRAIGDENT